jgi:hypothetical protein
MSQKTALLKAIRDELKAQITGVNNRVVVTLDDSEDASFVPMEMAPPFLTVSDSGMIGSGAPGRTEVQTYRVRIRAWVQNFRDVESPVIGHAGSSSLGAAEFQDAIASAMGENLLATRISGVELAQVEGEPKATPVGDKDWFGVAGDVLMRYDMTEAL